MSGTEVALALALLVLIVALSARALEGLMPTWRHWPEPTTDDPDATRPPP